MTICIIEEMDCSSRGFEPLGFVVCPEGMGLEQGAKEIRKLRREYEALPDETKDDVGDLFDYLETKGFKESDNDELGWMVLPMDEDESDDE